MKFFTFAFFSLGIFFLFPSAPFAGECPNSSPWDSKIWRDFQKVVETEYTGKVASTGIYTDDIKWKFLGHALGRLALAVQNQRDRKIAFDCVELGIEKMIAFSHFMQPTAEAILIQAMEEAGRGMHNDEVARLTGVRSMAPLYHLFGGKLENGHSAPGPVLGKAPEGKTTSSITKQDPATAGGGFTLEDPTKTGAPDGYCSNWMTIAFNNSKGENDAGVTAAACTSAGKTGDFITNYNPNSKVCSVCFLDDWSGSSDKIVSNGGTAENTGAVGEGKSHPCRNSNIKDSATWKFISGGTVEKKERGGVICGWPGIFGYSTYSSNAIKYFTCDKGLVNCRFKKSVPVEKVENKKDYTLYDLPGSLRAHRKPLP